MNSAARTSPLRLGAYGTKCHPQGAFQSFCAGWRRGDTPPKRRVYRELPRTLEEKILLCSRELERRPQFVAPTQLLVLAAEALSLVDRLGLSAHPEVYAFRLSPSWHTARGLLRFLAGELRRRKERGLVLGARKRREGER